MPQLISFPTRPQARPNSCWAAAGRAICNWYAMSTSIGPTYATDHAFAAAWATASHDPHHGDIDVQQSAAAALEDLQYPNNTDSRALPTADEIAATINVGMPLLAIVAPTAPNPSPNLAAHAGHWVVIIGIDDAKTTLTVYDPDPSLQGQDNVAYVAYDPKVYMTSPDPTNPWTLYWQNTSYVDGYQGAWPIAAPAPVPAPAPGPTPAPGPAPTPAPSPAPSPAPAPTPAAPLLPPGDFSGQFRARGGVTFGIGWTPSGDGRSATLCVQRNDTRPSRPMATQVLAAGTHAANQAFFPLGSDSAPVNLVLSLILTRQGPGTAPREAHLWADYPVTSVEAKHERIATWSLPYASPAPAPSPAPASGPAPSPAPGPAPTPAPAHRHPHPDEPAHEPACEPAHAPKPAPRPAPRPAPAPKPATGGRKRR